MGHEGKGEEGERLAVFTTHTSLRRLFPKQRVVIKHTRQSESLARTVV